MLAPFCMPMEEKKGKENEMIPRFVVVIGSPPAHETEKEITRVIPTFGLIWYCFHNLVPKFLMRMQNNALRKPLVSLVKAALFC